jgi:hypothetical protein
MVLSFTTGEYGKAAYGDAGSQTAGANGAIVQHNPLASAPQMKGGKRQRQKSQRQKRQNKSQKRHNGGRKSRKQRGGK